MLRRKHKLTHRINPKKAANEEAKPSVTHDARGKFAPGNKVGRGNPFAAKMMEYRTALYNAVTPDDFADVSNRLLLLAKAGDMKAIDTLFNRLIGRVPADLEAMLLERAGVEKDERFL